MVRFVVVGGGSSSVVVVLVGTNTYLPGTRTQPSVSLNLVLSWYYLSRNEKNINTYLPRKIDRVRFVVGTNTYSFFLSFFLKYLLFCGTQVSTYFSAVLRYFSKYLLFCGS